jgi:hypothetical protein
MKRFLALSTMAVVCGATAFAGTLMVPWYNDLGGPVAYSDPPTPSWGTATYVRLTNRNPLETLDVTIIHYNAAHTEVHRNTGLLGPRESWAWRPTVDEPSEVPPPGGPAPAEAHSMVVDFTGGTATDLVGNVVAIPATGGRYAMILDHSE